MREMKDDMLHPSLKRLRRENVLSTTFLCPGGFSESGEGNENKDEASSLHSHFSSSSTSSSSSTNSSSTASSFFSSSASSRSLSPVSTSELSLPVSIVRPMQSGNNGQVFLAHGMPHEEREAARRREQDKDTLQEVFLCGGAGDYVLKGMNLLSENLYMAVKLMHASSGHAQREVRCLKYLNGESVRESSVSVKADGGKSGCNSQIHCISSRSSPQLFFTKEVGRYVAVGIELLGPDLFDFTERFVLHEDELCLIGMEITRTLQDIHHRGIVHRSVKPENFCFNVHYCSMPQSEATDLPCTSSSDTPSSFFDESSPLMFKIIDYGRSTITSELSPPASYERPFTGWWYSLRGFLGKPMGQKDDLMGVVHTIGYLIDDYRRDKSCSASFSDEQDECLGETFGCSSSDSNKRVEAARGLSDVDVRQTAEGQSESRSREIRGRTYSACRRVLADKIYDAYRKAARLYRLESSQQTIPLETDSQRAERVNTRREHIVRCIERDFLEAFLPDNYFPHAMPEWWVKWFAKCSAMCNDDTVSANAMAAAMVESLQQRIDAVGGSVEETHRAVLECLSRYQQDRHAKEEKITQTMPYKYRNVED